MANTPKCFRSAPALGRSLLIAAAGLLAANTRAADYTWNADGATAGGSSTWNTTGTLWWNPVLGRFVAWDNTLNGRDQAVFDSTAGTVTLGQATSAGSLWFKTDGYTVTGSTLTLLSGITADANATLASAVTLAGTNTWTTSATKTLTVSGAVNNAGFNLTVGGAGNTTLSGVISGAGNLIKSGSGTMTLTGLNTFSGGLIVNAGTVNINNVGGAWSTNYFGSGATINSGGTLRLSGANNTGNSSVITVNGGGTVEWYDAYSANGSAANGGNANYIGTLNLNYSGTAASAIGVGAFRAGFGGNTTVNSTGYGTNLLSAGVMLVYAAGRTVTLSSEIGNTLNVTGAVTDMSNYTTQVLTKSGEGVVKLANTANSFVGGVTISAGTLEIGDAGRLGSGTYAGAISNSGTLLVSTSANQTLSGVISGAGSLVKSGAGTLTLSTNNTFTGRLIINGGTVVGAGSNGPATALGTASAIVINNGGTLKAAGTDNGLVGYTISGTQTITINAGGTLTNAGVGTTNHMPALILNGGSIVASSTSAYGGWDIDKGVSTLGNGSTSTISGAGSVALTQTGGTVFNVGVGDTVTLTSQVGASLVTSTGLTKSGLGTLVWAPSAVNDSGTAATIVNGGTLSLDFSQTTLSSQLLNHITAASNTLALGGGTLSLKGRSGTTDSQTVASLAVNAGGSSISFTGNGATSVSLVVGAISRSVKGTLDLVQPSGSSLTTTTGNSVGTTTVDTNTGIMGGWFTYGGTDWATAVGAAAPYTIAAFTGYTDDTWGAGIHTNVVSAALAPTTGSSTGTLRFNTAQASTLTLLGTNTLLNGGLLVSSNVGNNATTITGGVLSSGSTAVTATASELIVQQFNTANTLTIASVIANNGGATNTTTLVKSGPGTLILTGTNTYTGGTQIGAGTLQVGTTAALTGAVNISTGGTLLLNNVNNLTFANTFTGTGLIKVNFTANATAGGSNYSGISGFAGTLQLANLGTTGDKWGTGALSAPNLTLQIDSGSTFYNSGAVTLKQVNVIGSGNSEGRGALRLGSTLTAPVTLLGSTQMSFEGGTLAGIVTSGAAGTQTLTLGGTAATTGTLSGVIGEGTGTIALATTTAGTFSLTGINTFTGAISVAGSTTLQTTGAGKLGSGIYAGNIAIASGGTFGIGSTAGQVLSGTISGSGTLTKSAAGTLITAGTVTVSTLNSSGGTLNIVGSTTASTVNLNGSSTTAVQNGGSLTTSGLVSVTAATLNISTGATVSINSIRTGDAGGSPTSTINQTGGSFTVTGTSNTGGTDSSIVLSHWGSGTSVTNWNMSGGVFNATGTFIVLGWDGTGYVNLSGGTMNVLGINENSGRNNGGALNLTGGRINIGASGIFNDASTRNINLGAGTVGALSNWTGSTAITLNSTGGGTIFNTLDATDGITARTITISGVLAGAGSLIKEGAGTLTLSGVNTYSGTTQVNVGTINLSNASALAGSTFIGGAGSLVFDASAGTTFNVGGLGGVTNLSLVNNAVTPAGITLAIGGTNLSSAYAGAMSGLGGVTKNGSGTFTLAGANTYTGATTVNAGTLALNFASPSATNSTSNILASTSAVTLGGTSTLSVIGKASTANTQTFASTAVAASSLTNIQLSSGASGSVTLNLGTLSRGALSILNLTSPTSGGFTVSGRLAGTITDASNGGAFVVLNGTSWASVDGSGNVTAAANTSGDTALSGNVNLTGNTRLTGNSSASGVSITSGAYTLQNGGYTLATGGILSNQTTSIFGPGAISTIVTGGELSLNQTAGTLTITAPIVDNLTPVSIAKYGAGTVSLNGYNTFTGGISIVSGALQVGGTGVLNTGSYAGAISIATGSTLAIASSSNQILSGVLSGAGAITKSGTGLLTVSGGSNSGFTGNFTVNGGILKLTGASIGPSNTAVTKVTVNSGGTLDVNGAGAAYGYTIAGTGALGTGALINTGGDPSTGNAQMSNLALSANASLGGTGDFGLLTNGYAATTLTLNNYTLTKVGFNRFYLANSTVTAGTVHIASGQIYLFNSATNGSAATWNLQNTAFNNSNYGAALNLNGIALSVGALTGGGATGGNIALGSGTLTVGGLNTSTTYAGTIFGTGGVTKTGTGTLTLTGNSGFSGKLTIGGGSVATSVIGNSGFYSPIGTNGVIDVTAGTVGLVYTGTGETTNKVINFATASTGGYFTNNGTGTLTFVNPFTSAAGSYGVGFYGTGNTVINGITQPATPILINFNKNDTGSLTVTGSLNLLGGSLRANGGTLTLASTSSSGSSTVGSGLVLSHAIGGTLRVLSSSIFSQTAGTNTNGIIGGWATYGDNTWAVYGAVNTALTGLSSFVSVNTAATSNYDVTGNLTLTTLGANSIRFNTLAANTLTLATGVNTLASGGILVSSAVGANISTISGGTIAGPAAAGSVVANDIVVTQNNTAGSLVISSVIGNGAAVNLTKTGAGLLSLTGINTYTGATYINQGTLSIDGAGQLAAGTYSGAIVDSTSLIYNSSASQTLSGVISGIGSLSVTGSGNLTLSGANTFTGSVNVSAGTLTLGAANRLSLSSGLNLSGGTLAITTFGQSLAALNITGAATVTGTTGVISASSVNVSNASGTATISAILGGTGALNKSGAGALVLSGANTLSGGVNVTAGTLTLTGANTYTAATSITESSLNLDFSAVGAPTNNILASGSSVNLNRSTLTLTGSSTAANAQTLAGLTLNGANQITLTTNATTAQNLALTIGSITRTTGGALSLTQPSGTIGTTNGVTLTGVSGFVGGWATTGTGSNQTYLVADANGLLSAASTISATYVTNALITGVTSNNWGTAGIYSYQTAGLNALTSNVSVNLYRATNVGAVTLDLAASNLTLNGMMNVGTGIVTISRTGAGTVVVGSGRELSISGNQGFAISAPIVNNAAGASTLVYNGSGTLSLSGTNTYTGGTIINSGIVDLTGGGGASGTIRGAVTVNNGGTLRLTGGDSTGYNNDSTVISTVNLVGGTLNYNTTGNQTWSGTTFNLTAGVINGIAGSKADISFNNVSTFNVLAAATSSTISNVTFSIRNSSGVIFNVADGAAAYDLDMSNVLSNSGVTAGPVVKTGAGTMRMTGANTYTGATTLQQGSILLDFGAAASATNILASGGSLALSGGVFQVAGKSATINSQTLTGMTLAVMNTGYGTGSSTINLTQGGATSLALNVGAITRNIGTTLNIVQSVAGGAAQGVITSRGNVNNILGGYATVNGTDWAVANGASGITAFTGYTLQSGTQSATANYDIQASATLTTAGANSLRFNTAAATTLTLATGVNSIVTGGILVTPNVGGYLTTIAGGTSISSGSTGVTNTASDLIINQANTGNSLVISSIIANNGATGNTTALTKTGAGWARLSGANTFTGNVFVNQGTLEITGQGNNIARTYNVAAGASLRLGTSLSTGVTYGYGVALNVYGNGVSDSTGLYLLGGNGHAFGGTLSLLGAPTTVRSYGSGIASIYGGDVNSLHLSVAGAASGSVLESGVNVAVSDFGFRMNVVSGRNNATGDLVLNGLLSGSGSSTGLRYQGGGSLKLNGQVTLTSQLEIQNGTIIIGAGDNRLPNVPLVTLGNSTTSGRLALGDSTGYANVTLPYITVSGTGTTNGVVGNSTAVSTLTLNGSSSQSYSGNFFGGTGTNQNNLALSLAGTSNVTLTGTNTLVGGVTVGGSSTLNLGVANAIDVANAVTVSGGTLGISSFNQSIGALTVSSGSITSTTGTLSATSFAFTNTLALATSTILSGSGNLTKSGGGTLTLSAANTYTGTTTVNDGTLLLTNTANVASALINNGGVVTVSSTGTVSALTNTAGVLTANTATTVGNVSVSGGALSVSTATSLGAVNVSGGLLSTAAANINAGVLTVSGGTANFATGLTTAGATITGGVVNLGASTTFNSASTLNGGAVYLGGTGAAGTLAVNGNLTASSTLFFDLSSDPASGSDRINVTGSANLTGLSGINFNLLNGSLGAGSYILISSTTGITSPTLALTNAALLAGLPLNGSRQAATTGLSVLNNQLLLNVGSSVGTLAYVNGGNATSIWSTGTNDNVWYNPNPAIVSQTGGSDNFYNGDLVTFGNQVDGSSNPIAAASVTLSGDVAPGSITFTNTSATTYTLSGSGKITGATSLVVSGGGRVVLATSGNNFTGGTSLTNGTLELGAINALSSSMPVTIAGGTLAVGSTIGATVGAVTMSSGSITETTGSLNPSSLTLTGGTLAADITGLATITFNGAGQSWTYANTSTASGGIRVQAGTLNLSGSALGGVTVSSGATYNLAGTQTGGLTSAGTSTIGSAGSLSGGFTLTAGSLSSDGAITGGGTMAAGTTLTSTGTLTGNILNNGAVTFGGSTARTYSEVISGSGSLIKTNNGNLTLTNTNTYTGTTTVSAGTLQIGTGSTSGSIASGSAVSVASGATVAFYRNDGNLILANTISGSGTVSSIGNGVAGQSAYSFTGTNSAFTGNWNIGANTRMTFASQAQLGATNATVTLAPNGQIYLASAITYANNLTIAGPGWTELTAAPLGAIRYSGSITTGTITLAGNATITAYASSGTINGAIGESAVGSSLSYGATGLGTAGTLTVNTNNTYTGGTNLLGAVTVNANTSGAFGTGAVNVGGSASFASLLVLGNGINLANNLNLNANAGIAGGVVQLSGSNSATISGLVTLGAAAPTTGNFFGVGTGTLSLLGGVTSATGYTFGAGNYTVSGGMVAGGNLSIGSGTTTIAGGITTTNAGTLTFGSGTYTVTGGINSAGAVTLGSGTYTLAGGGNYPSLSLAGGTLKLGSANGLGTTGLGAATLTLGTSTAATLDLNGYSQSNAVLLATTSGLTVTNTSATAGSINVANGSTSAFNFTGNLALVLSGSASKNLTGTNSYTGGTSVTAGSLDVTTLAAINYGALALSGGNFSLTSNSANTLTGQLSGSGSFSKNGTGVLTLAGSVANYSGALNINAGSVVISGSSLAGSSGNGSAITLANSTSLSGSFTTARDISVLSGATLRASTGLTTGSIVTSGVLDLGYVASGVGLSQLNVVIGNTASDVIDVTTGTLKLSGNVNVSFVNGGFGTGRYNFLTYNTGNVANDFTGTLHTIGNYGHTSISEVVQDTTSGVFYVDVTKTSMVWAGDLSSDVDSTTANFKLGTSSVADTLLVGDELIFNDTSAVRTVNLTNSIPNLGRITVDTTAGYTIAGTGGFAGQSAQLIKTGTGTLVLGGTNTFGGGTIISDGTLQLNSNGTLLSTGDVTVAGGTLSIGATTQTFGTLNVSGGAVTSTGTLNVVDANLSAGSVTGTLNASGTAAFTGGNLNGALVAANLNASGTLSGTGTITAGSYSFSDGTVVNSGLTLGGAGSIGRSSPGTVRIEATVANTGGVSVSSGTLVLTGSNTYTGGTLLSGSGTIQVGSAGALGAAAATLTLNGGKLSSDSTVARILTAVGASTLGGDVTLGDAVNTGALTLNNAFNLGGLNRTLTIASGVTLGGVISNGSLTKAGTGTLTLLGTNTYSGGTTISGGTVILGAAAAIGTGAATVNSGATLDLAGYTPGISVAISGTGNGTNSALWNSSATGVSVTALNLGANATVGNTGAGSDSLSSTMGVGTLNLNGYKLTITSGTISLGIGSIGSGDIQINNGASMYVQNGGSLSSTGTITINAGGKFDTRDTSNTALASVHTIYLNGGQLGRGALSGNNGGGAGTYLKNNIIVDGTNGGTIFNSSSGGFAVRYTLSGSLSGSGALALNGYTGVEFQGDTSAYTGTMTISNGTTFNPTTATQVFNGNISGTSSVTKSGSNTTVFTKSNSFSGGATLSGGTLRLANTNALSGSTLTMGGGSLSFDSSVNTFNLGGLAASAAGSGYDIALNNNATTPAAIALTVGGNNANTTYAGVLGGLGSLTKAGTGTLTLSGINTFTGNMAITAGTVDIGGSGSLGSGSYAGSIANAGTLSHSSSAAQTLSGVISGSGGISKSGSGVLTLSGANTYTGSTNLMGGTVVVSDINDSSVSSFGGFVSEATNFIGLKNTTLSYTGAGSQSTARYLWIDQGAGTFDITQATGSLTFTSTGGNLTNNVVTKNGLGALEIQDNILGTASIAVNAGTLSLTADNAYSGGTTLAAGTLRAGNSGALGAAGAAVTLNGGTLQLATDTTLSSKAVTLGGNSTIVLDRATSGAGLTTTLGTLTSTTGDRTLTFTKGNNVNDAASKLVFNGQLSLSGRITTMNVGSDVTVELSGGTIGGAQTINMVKQGAGTLIISSDSYGTWDGGNTTLSAGTLELRGLMGDAIQYRAGLTSAANTTLRLARDTDFAFLSTLAVNGNTTVEIGRITSGITNATHSLSTLSIGASTLSVNRATSITGSGVGGMTFTGATTLTGNATFSVGSDATLTMSGAIGGAGFGLTKSGNGTMTLGVANTYNGGTTVNAGTLNLGVTNALVTTSALTLNGGTLSINSNNQTVGALALNGGALTGSGTVTASTITSNVATGSTASSSAVLAGSSSLTKSGNGTLTLTGTNTYTGGTVVSGGSLVGNTNSIKGALTNNASVTFDQATNATFANAISGNGNFDKAGNGTLTLSGVNTHNGATNITSGKLVIGNTSSAGSGLYNVGFNGTLGLGFALTDNTALTNTFTGTGIVDVATSGNFALTLSGLSTYNGTIKLSTGLFDAAASGWTGNLLFAGGALSGGLAGYAGQVTVSNGSTVSAATGLPANLVLAAGGTIDFTGVSSNTSITFAGGTLSNAGSFTGDVVVLGTDVSVGAGALGGGTLVVGTGNSVNITGANSNSIRATGGRITGGSNLTGAVIVSAGNFKFGAAVGEAGIDELTSNAELVLTNANVNLNNTYTDAGITYNSGSITNAANYQGTLTIATDANLTMNGTIGGTVAVGDGATLSGSGNFNNVLVSEGGILNPGNSPGVQTHTGTLTLSGGSVWVQQIFNQQETLSVTNANGDTITGRGYDTLVITSGEDGETMGVLDLSDASSINKITLRLMTLTNWVDSTGGTPTELNLPLAYGIDGSGEPIPKQFVIATASNVLLSAALTTDPLYLAGGNEITSIFAFDTSGYYFSDGTLATSNNFSVFMNFNADSGLNELTLRVVPEPSTYGILLGGLALAAAAIRRKRLKAKVSQVNG